MAAVARRVPPLPTIQELIRVYKLGAKKRLSQNFLLHQRTIEKLVRCAGDLTGRPIIMFHLFDNVVINIWSMLSKPQASFIV